VGDGVETEQGDAPEKDASDPAAIRFIAPAISAALYRGRAVGCTYCAYEVRAAIDGSTPRVPPATRLVETAKGPRELCEMHAVRGRWRERGRRVGAVA
jgi:hypothetical protein